MKCSYQNKDWCPASAIAEKSAVLGISQKLFLKTHSSMPVSLISSSTLGTIALSSSSPLCKILPSCHLEIKVFLLFLVFVFVILVFVFLVSTSLSSLCKILRSRHPEIKSDINEADCCFMSCLLRGKSLGLGTRSKRDQKRENLIKWFSRASFSFHWNLRSWTVFGGGWNLPFLIF